jgi:hypothetical protein
MMITVTHCFVTKEMQHAVLQLSMHEPCRPHTQMALPLMASKLHITAALTNAWQPVWMHTLPGISNPIAAAPVVQPPGRCLACVDPQGFPTPQAMNPVAQRYIHCPMLHSVHIIYSQQVCLTRHT